jgi:formyl-CoA transferase
VELDDAELGVLKNIGIPVKLSLTPGRIRHRAPDLGEHTKDILLQAGYADDDIAKLREVGAIKA